jgi:hypothetical protein
MVCKMENDQYACKLVEQNRGQQNPCFGIEV